MWLCPLLRFVAAMCRLAMEFELELTEGPYDRQGERYARDLLMPKAQFAALAWLRDRYLATCFAVPAEQIGPRRLELGLRGRHR